MKVGMTVFCVRKRRLWISVMNILMIGLFIGLSSCKEDNPYLKRAIQNDECIFPFIYTQDSVAILIDVYSQSMIRELKDKLGVRNPEQLVYESIETNIPICVSKEFYNEYKFFQIYPDSVTTEIYEKAGVEGLLDAYIKDDKSFILWAHQYFPYKGEEPYEFGQNYNTYYIAYLLSKHNIYFEMFTVDEDEISIIAISKWISDDEKLKVFSSNKKEK